MDLGTIYLLFKDGHLSKDQAVDNLVEECCPRDLALQLVHYWERSTNPVTPQDAKALSVLKQIIEKTADFWADCAGWLEEPIRKPYHQK